MSLLGTCRRGTRWWSGVCEKTFSCREHMMHHKGAIHSNQIWICGICSKTFKNKIYLTGHIKRNHSVKPPELLICDICSKVLIGKAGLRQHLDPVHVDSFRSEKSHV